MKPITVLLAEDHIMVREGLRKMLELEKGFKVVGEADDGRQAVRMAKKLRPSVILMDVAMQGLNGIEATRQVLRTMPCTKVLILSAHNDDVYVQTAIESGAMGFVLKQTTASDVCRAIRQIDIGHKFFSPSIQRRLDRLNLHLSPSGNAVNVTEIQLTSREMEVLQLIAEGMSNKQVAGRLEICLKTAEKHREHLMEKLDIHDTAGLTRYAISTGIIQNHVQAKILRSAVGRPVRRTLRE